MENGDLGLTTFLVYKISSFLDILLSKKEAPEIISLIPDAYLAELILQRRTSCGDLSYMRNYYHKIIESSKYFIPREQIMIGFFKLFYPPAEWNSLDSSFITNSPDEYNTNVTESYSNLLAWYDSYQ